MCQSCQAGNIFSAGHLEKLRFEHFTLRYVNMTTKSNSYEIKNISRKKDYTQFSYPVCNTEYLE
jgi:hypothetical protein